jgi:hypothetical protein
MLPRVSVVAQPGAAPRVSINGVELPAVRSAQVTSVVDGIPQVSVVFAAAQVDLDADAQVTVVTAGPGVSEFADRLDPRRLERDALAALDEDATQGEAFAAAVRLQAADWDT